jgi:hypothetical protein
MQWHPIFAHLLRPLVEAYYEVRTDQTVGDLPRQSDIVLLRKTTTAPAPFQGLWRRLTTWNVLEYKGPTVSPRFDELHDLLELGLGIHRRLNELASKEEQPQVGYAEVSFWYLVNHLGRRFLAELPTYLPGAQQVTEGVWQASVYGHPVLLVSVQDLRVERDSMPLIVLAGVPEAEKGTITEVLKAEPALWRSYGAWLARCEPAIWQEIVLMAAQKNQAIALDFDPLAEYFRATGDTAGLKSFLKAVGVKQAIEAFGVAQAVEAVGVKQVMDALETKEVWEALSPERREELRRLIQQEGPPPTKPTE